MRVLAFLALLAAVGPWASAAPAVDEVALYERGWTWEDIGQAQAIARRARVKVDRVVELRDAGLGWSQISEGHGFKLADVAKEAHELSAKALERHGSKVKPRVLAALPAATTETLAAPSLVVKDGPGAGASPDFSLPASTEPIKLDGPKRRKR